MKRIFIITALVLLAGCSTQASRMADCRAQGISKDACYIVEQNRQTAIETTAMKQAMENSAKQYAQTAKRVVHVRIKGIDIKIFPGDKQGYIESTAAALDEDNADAQVYRKGIFTAIYYKRTHKVVLMRNGQIYGRTAV
ncbi:MULTISPECIES: hypothetical protein [Rahnella]|uniref:Lipoprotein n=1 Tax=Rahnella laticis TaxID=2787622 RepID=A0ABS0E808_9GAMM|nr:MULTISPECIES: hypothetical protein [Rahnella]MBF7981223.1 hypothetical protein [Rahnella laticis]MBF7993498.1 hypothetical protein [Rahnella laticis]MBF8001315.1 hypothetical protein [Rahnella sp. LAC-M12]MBV6819316.1 hypothetical protein [Rahnella sp. PD12R]